MYDAAIKEALDAHLGELVARGRALKFPIQMPSRQLGKGGMMLDRIKRDLDALHREVREKWPDPSTPLTVLVDEEPGGRVLLVVVETPTAR